MSGSARRWALVALAVLAAAGLVLLPVNRWLLAFIEWVRAAGPVGVAVFVLAYVSAAAFLLPGSVLTLGAGFVYGPVKGTLLVIAASNLAALVSFALGRTALRGWVSRKLEGHPRFAAIDRAVEARGFRMVLLLRLSPVVPFSLLNYALALTRVRGRHYAVASFLGMLPGTALYVYLGSLVTSAAQLTSGQRPDAGLLGAVLFWGGLLATFLVTVLVTRLARRALDETLATPTSASRAPPP